MMQTNGHRRSKVKTKAQREEARAKRAENAAARRRTAKLMDIIGLEAESGLSRYTWRSWIQAKRIPVVHLGRRTLVERETFEAMIRDGRVAARASRTA